MRAARGVARSKIRLFSLAPELVNCPLEARAFRPDYFRGTGAAKSGIEGHVDPRSGNIDEKISSTSNLSEDFPWRLTGRKRISFSL
jgi:hypothetical protein